MKLICLKVNHIVYLVVLFLAYKDIILSHQKYQKGSNINIVRTEYSSNNAQVCLLKIYPLVGLFGCVT